MSGHSDIPPVDILFTENSFAQRWQLLMISICSIATIYSGIFVISPSFFRFQVPYYCQDNIEDTCDDGCSDWSFNYTTLDVPTSLQESYNLVCDKELYIQLHGSLYFLGLCIGSVIGGYLSDKLGRAKWLSIAHFVNSILGVIMGVTNSLFINLFCWCLLSALCMSTWVSACAYNAETGKAKFRHVSVGILNCVFSSSIALCSPLAYLFPSWRHLLISISAITFLCFILSLFNDESPRWLWSQRRYAEVYEIMKKSAKLQHEEIPADTENLLISLSKIGKQKGTFTERVATDFKNVFGWNINPENDSKMPENEQKSYSIFDIRKYPRLAIRLVFLAMHWVCVNTLYYGLSFGAEMFHQNAYVFVLTQGFAGLIGGIFGLFLLNFAGRKTLAIANLKFAGACYLACVFIPLSQKFIILVITFSAKISLEFFFVLCYLWTSDLMPTVIRTSGIGLASSMARITGMALPFVGKLAVFGSAAPLIFYSSLAFIVIICSVFLPESRGHKLPNTLEEGNEFGTNKSRMQNNHEQKTEMGTAENVF